MASEGLRSLARTTARTMGKSSGVSVPFSVSSSLGKRSRVEALDEALASYMSPPKKPMALPGASTRPSPRRRRPVYDQDRLKLRHSILDHKDPHSSSSRTIGEELEAFFKPAATSQQSRPTQPGTRAPRASRAKNIPHSRRSPPREHVQREMTNPKIPSISEEDISEMSELISTRSKKRGAAEAFEEPATPLTDGDAAASPQPGKRQRTSSSASSLAPSPATKLSSQSLWSLESMPPSAKKMEAMAYQRSLSRRRLLKRGSSAEENVGGGRVAQWMDGLRVSRSWMSTPSLRREVHNATRRMQKMKVDDPGS